MPPEIVVSPAISQELLQNWVALSAAGKVLVVSLCGLVMLVYAYTAWIVLSGAARWVVRRVRRPAGPAPAPRRRGWRVLRGATLTLAAAGVLCVVYAFRVEPYWPEVTRFETRSDRLPAGAGFIRIVHISDTHCDGDTARLENDLPDLIRREKPDLIVWTGDAANDVPMGLDRFRRMMVQLTEIAPTYGVLGNWDQYGRATLPGIDVTMVDGSHADVDVRGIKLRLVGGQWHQARSVAYWTDRADPMQYVILLAHGPDFILMLEEQVKGGRVPDLFLAGHTHGGQIRLPFYGAVVVQQKTGKLFENGLVDYNGTQVHVSRGIGMNGNLPRARFLCRPEVAVIDVFAAKESAP
jgi:hypothetical protein